VRLGASTKPHVHQNFEIFWTNIASTMAYPNFKNGPKKGLGPLGVKHPYLTYTKFDLRIFYCYEFSTSISSHLPFRFPLEEKKIAFKL
jgi:hypothetical protein